MIDRLPAIRARVDDQAIAAFGDPCLVSKLARDAEEMPHHLLVFRLERVDGFDVLVRHDQ